MPPAVLVFRKQAGLEGSRWIARGLLHPPWGIGVRVPTVLILGFSVFSFLLLIWGPLELDCGSQVGGLREVGAGDGAGGRSISAAALTDEVDAMVIAEMLEAEGGVSNVRRKVLGVVGIHTGFEALARRKALRETWVPGTPEGIARLEEATGLVIRFVIGSTKDAEKTAALQAEVETFNDFLVVDVEETSDMQSYKTLAFLKAAYKLFDADFYVKADDNIYLRTDRLSTLLAKDRTSPRTYLGCMKNGPVVREPGATWYEPLAYMLGSEYFYHAYGPIYALSAAVAASLASARNNSLRIFKNDDVTMGVWMLAKNIEYEDNRALCDPECRATSVAVWDIPMCAGLCDAPTKLLQLHSMDICSKSPTLPADP